MTESTTARERTSRRRGPRAPRHRSTSAAQNFAAGFRALGDLAYAGAEVSAKVVDLETERVLVAIDDHIVLPTAGIGTILLLVDVSARITAGEVSGYTVLDRSDPDAVGGSGVWQHLHVPALPVADVAALVAATADGVATNVLLRRVGLDAVRARAESLGLGRLALLDLVRDERGPDDAPQLSVGSASELAWLFRALARRELVDAPTSARVLGWLSLNADLSLVASAFGLDPLSHRGSDHDILLVNKTGSDDGVRAEAGVVRGRAAAVAYAVSVRFEDRTLGSRLRVVDALRTVGYDLLEYVH